MAWFTLMCFMDYIKRNYLFLMVIASAFVVCIAKEYNNGSATNHSRRKRYTAFPEGSSFSVAVCTTIGQIGNPNVNFISYALNWGVSYELPNDTWITQYAHGFKNTKIEDQKHVIQRRSRRSLYEEVQVILDSMGYNGKDCIMRALCESKRLLDNQVGSMEVELLKRIFSLPTAKVLSREHRSVHEYDAAYRNIDNENCAVSYSGCGFSLIALAFGKHSRAAYGLM